MPILKNWATVADINPYRAPEAMPSLKLRGVVFDHPEIEDGQTIETSSIKKAIGRLVETKSGSVYTLEGDPDPDWSDYLESIGYDLDVENPVQKKDYEDSHYYRVLVRGGDG